MTRKTASVIRQSNAANSTAARTKRLDDRHLGEHLLGQVSHRLIVPQQDSGQVSCVTGE